MPVDVRLAAPADLEAGNLRTLDGLRGLAAIYVMLYHARALMWCGWVGFAANWNSQPLLDRLMAIGSLGFRYGQEAVLLFFVLSGFVIHYRQAKQAAIEPASMTLDLRDYWRKRLVRLYPPLLLALLLTFGADSWGAQMNPGFYSGVNRPASITLVSGDIDHSAATLLGNTVFLQGPVVKTFGTNTPLWSLSYEFYFYLLYPLYLLAYRRWGARAAYLGVVVIGLVSIGLTVRFGNWPWKTFVYFPVWCSGAACADLYARRRSVRRSGLLLAVVAATLIGGAIWGSSLLNELNIWLWGAAFTGLFIYLLLPTAHTRIRSWLQKLLIWCAPTAGFSYSLYVIHFPLAVLASALYLRQNATLPGSFWAMMIVAMGCLVAAFVASRMVEAPFLKSRRLATSLLKGE